MFKGALPESVRKIWKSGTSISSEELSEDDVIIALMGPTGAGKSSFIKKATGFDSRIGHELQSCTTEIGIIRVQCVERSHFDVVFVDTPGFDDTNKSDGEILEMIAQWLNTTYERNITLSGILYLHRISDNRMAGTPLKNLRIFKKLCGKNALQNIILTTTMWDDVNRREGLEREKDLKENYWKVMLKQKSTVARYDNTTESAWQVVEPLLREANKRSALRLQQEMVELKRELPETKAGGELYTRLEVAFRKQQDTLERIRMETKRAENDRVLDDLKAEYDELRKKAEVIIADMQALKVPLGRRFVRILTSGLGIMRILPGGHLHGHH
jgi:predicted GTPase